MSDQAPMTTARRVAAILRDLGVDEDYAANCRMPLQLECTNLVPTELDVFGRQPMLEAATHTAWLAMKAAAASDGVTLQIVSAFRSIDYQKGLLERKLARGDTLAAILQVNAAPGYSEHHTGRAIDIGCPGFPHLEVEFEHSPAFAWLGAHAAEYGFSLSFPRDNPYGVQYEPWHWCHGRVDAEEGTGDGKTEGVQKNS